MQFLTLLGIDITAVYQFFIFLVGYIFLYNFIFKPYYNAYNVRQEKTVGNQETSENILKEIEHLKLHHEEKAREINDEFKIIYDDSRTKAMEEYDRITMSAREKAKMKIEETKQHIQKEVQRAQADIEKQVPEVMNQVVTKILS